MKPLVFTWGDDQEEWRPIPSCPAYSASSHGRIRREKEIAGHRQRPRPAAGDALSMQALPRGHLRVTMSVDNRRRYALVHRLVAEAFLPPPEDGCDCVCHRDDDPSNNRPANLFWGTRADNTRDMVVKGRQCKGERVSGAKLSPSLIASIRERIAAGRSQRSVAKEFGVAQSNVSLIVNRRTWAHTP